MKNKRKYKLQSGIQRIEMDTPDYSKAYELQAEEGAKNQGIKNAAAQFSGAYAPVGQLGGMAGDVIKSRNKSKGGATTAGAVSMGASGAALGMQVAGPWGALAGAAGGAVYGGITAGKEYEKGKRLQKEAEHKTAMENANKGFSTYALTDAQSAIAKRGKYKLRTGTSTFKQPREIETEGREPIFSPPNKNGKRKLLYYNPNDPTHEEGGVKAMVIPKAQKGKQKVKIKAKPVEEPYTPLEDNDSTVEEIAEVFDPTGISSWDDVYRSGHNIVNKKNKGIDDYVDLGLTIMGAVPVIGKVGKLGKLAKTAFKYIDKGADAGKIIKRAKQIQKAAAGPKTGNILTRTIKNIRNSNASQKIDRLGDLYGLTELAKENVLFENPDWDRTHTLENAKILGRKIFPTVSGEKMYPYGAKQLKVNTLNNTALSSNLTGMPAVNAANKFVQPMTGINQVARNIPEVRRKEKIKTPRSHKTANPDTNRIIDPPMLYEMIPPPPKSTFNTKNDFKKGSTKVKVYR